MKKRVRIGRLPNGQIDWQCLETKACLALARKGIGYKRISKETSLTSAQIGNRLRQDGAYVSDYRTGKSPEAIRVIEGCRFIKKMRGKTG